jgi:hypothetical protein
MLDGVELPEPGLGLGLEGTPEPPPLHPASANAVKSANVNRIRIA